MQSILFSKWQHFRYFAKNPRKLKKIEIVTNPKSTEEA